MLLTFLILIVLKRDPDPGNGFIPEVGGAYTGSGRAPNFPFLKLYIRHCQWSMSWDINEEH